MNADADKLADAAARTYLRGLRDGPQKAMLSAWERCSIEGALRLRPPSGPLQHAATQRLRNKYSHPSMQPGHTSTNDRA